MIVLDTNVVSAPMRPVADPAVKNWLDQQVAETLYLTATSLSELLLGIELLPKARRKEGLDAALAGLVERLFGSRILPFDQQAAVEYARLIGRARVGGRTISVADGQIAAIASMHGFTVATRDSERFLAVGVPVINPWQAKL